MVALKPFVLKDKVVAQNLSVVNESGDYVYFTILEVNLTIL